MRGKSLDRKRRRYWGRYARDLADRMELRDWTINMMIRPAEEGADAACQCLSGSKTANVMIGLNFDGLSPEQQRQTICHELLHLHLSGIERVIIDAKQTINKYWFDIVFTGIGTHMEHAVDAIADGYAKAMPLPPVKKAKGKKE